MSVIRSFSKAASTYDEYAIVQRKMVDQLYQQIKPDIGGHILDAGCGTGYFQEVLRKYGHRNELTQMDISPAMCEIAKMYAAVPEFATTHTICADIMAMPFADNYFDLVFSSMVMQWTQPLLALKECIRCLKPGGTLAVSIVGEGTLSELQRLAPSIVNPAVSTQEWQGITGQLPLKKAVLGEFIHTAHHPTVIHLLRTIKGIGGNHLLQQPRLLRSKGFFKKIDQAYQARYKNAQGLPVTWRMLTLVGKK